MQNINKMPQPIRMQILYTLVTGMAVLVVGLCFSVALKDKIALTLSLALLSFSLFKAFYLWSVGYYGNYFVIAGLCVSCKEIPYSKKIEVTLESGNDISTAVMINKRMKVSEGSRYIFYYYNQSLGEQLEMNLIGVEEVS